MSIHIKTRCKDCIKQGSCDDRDRYEDYVKESLMNELMEYYRSPVIYSGHMKVEGDTDLSISCQNFLRVSDVID